MQFVNLTLQLAKVDGMTQLDNLCQNSKNISESLHGTKEWTAIEKATVFIKILV